MITIKMSNEVQSIMGVIILAGHGVQILVDFEKEIAFQEWWD